MPQAITSLATNPPAIYAQFDDFVFLPDVRRAQALAAEYSETEATGAIYPGISRIEKPLPGDEKRLLNRIGAFSSYASCFRLTLPTMSLPTYIHNDKALGDLTGVLYLNRRGSGGTAFWKHKDTGLVRMPEDASPELIAQIVADGNDESKWQRMITAEMKYNRLIVFDSSLFHSCYPRGGFGQTIDDGRLLQAFFIKA